MESGERVYEATPRTAGEETKDTLIAGLLQAQAQQAEILQYS
jgi:hypothetical protein